MAAMPPTRHAFSADHMLVLLLIAVSAAGFALRLISGDAAAPTG
jgi:hypothetical protein